MGWLADKLAGVRNVLAAGIPFPRRQAINFVGATVTDNAAQDRTDVTVDLADLEDATHEPTPETIVRRSPTGSANFDGTCQFESIRANDFALRAEVVETRVLESTPVTIDAGWSQDASGFWTNGVLAGALEIPLAQLPNGAEVREVRVRIAPVVSHGDLPAQMPVLALWYLDTTDGSVTVVKSEEDPSADVAAYEVPHDIVVADLEETALKGARRYWLVLTAEDGLGAELGASYRWATATWARLAGSAIGQD